MSATITLPVHPRYGEKINVVRAFGTDALEVETVDGCTRLMPVRWTSLRQPNPLELLEEPPRLAREPLRKLANWVASRAADCEKLDHFNKRTDKVALDGAVREGTPATIAAGGRGGRAAGGRRSRGVASTVVEQAGAPRAGRGERQARTNRKRDSR